MIGDCESSQHLLRLASGRSAGDRMVLATSLVDLLAEMELDLSDRETALIDDILNKLIEDFETAVRRELADRLSSLECSPNEAIVALAHDEIDVAKPILVQSSALRDQDLIEIIHNRSRQHQMSIALRNMVSKAVSDALVETGDEAVITSLLSNQDAQISDATLAYLVGESRRVDSYHEPLVLREDLSDELAEQIYDIVAKDLRNHILRHFELDPEVLDAELASLPADLMANAARSADETRHGDAPERLAKALASAKKISPDFLVKVLRAGRINLFEALIGQLTGVESQTLRKLLYNTDGKALAAICRAMGIPKKQFIEVYLLIGRSRPSSRTTCTREVGTIVRYFDRITPAGALEALAHWRGDLGAGLSETLDSDAR
jgi:uncharacterized protein (DUF2336 family)